MSDEPDVIEENLSRLLRDAEEPPKMDPTFKEEGLRALQAILASTVAARPPMRFATRWVVGLCGAAAAAVILLALRPRSDDPKIVDEPVVKTPIAAVATSVDGPSNMSEDRLTPTPDAAGAHAKVESTLQAEDIERTPPTGMQPLAQELPAPTQELLPLTLDPPRAIASRDLAEEVGGRIARTTVSSVDLGGPDRFLTHLSTDKPVYRVGETVYVRGVVLHAQDNTPLTEPTLAQVEIRDPKGVMVASSLVTSQESVAAFTWKVPAGSAGGRYKVTLDHPMDGHAPTKREFDIRSYRAPRLKSQIVFLRDGYGPGDRAGAALHVERAEGGIPLDAKVTAVARVDGKVVATSTAIADSAGNCTVFFRLPERIERGQGTLGMTIEDGGVVETATTAIPILLQTVDLSAFPEGGDLIAGLPCRVYLSARTPTRKPADIAGVVIDAKGDTVAHFRTEHEGRGRFTFTPEAGARYRLRITEPSGINASCELSDAKLSGVVLHALEEWTGVGRSVRLGVGVTSERIVAVTISKRELEVASTRLKVRPGGLAAVTLTLPASASGVLVATVWGETGKPLAERLVYREPAQSLNVEVIPDLKQYVPGGTVKLTVKATDNEGNPVGALVGVTVTDDTVLEMIEKREQAPRLPVMVFLENEVEELADAHIYLDPLDPKAPVALDLLLGTQGWRRFAYVDPHEFVKGYGDLARRAVAMRAPEASRMPESGQSMIDRFMRRSVVVRTKDSTRRLEKLVFLDFGPEESMPGEKRVEVWDDSEIIDGDEVARRDPGADRASEEEEQPPLDDRQDEANKVRMKMKELLGWVHEDTSAAREAAGPIKAREFRRFQPGGRPSVAVRVYAHSVRPTRRPGDRVDFAETLYWNAGVRTDAKTGEATVSFDLSDSVTTFRAFADAFSTDGALGAGEAAIESVEPFYLESKLPLEVAAGDVIEIPVGIVNSTSRGLANVQLRASAAGRSAGSFVEPFDLASDTRARQLLTFRVSDAPGEIDITISGRAGPYRDKVTRKLMVKPNGFPVEAAFGGMATPRGSVHHVVDIPDSVVRESVRTRSAVHPTPLASMTDALERLMREPHGCFEQTSSTTYPLVMAQQYFTTHQGVEPEIIRRSNELLDKGYKKLTSFECKKRGYEWFGADPGHGALTAFGLLEFTDMAAVREVDQDMLARTRKWLLGLRDGKGGFSGERRALHSWIKDPDCSNAYITWALLEAGEKGLDRELSSLEAAAAASKNSYVTALAANVMHLAGRKGSASEMMQKLAARQAKDGSVDGATTSIVGSGGAALKIETTALATLAWMRDEAFTAHVEKAIAYIAESCKGGRYGSTQSTVLALRAIVAYDKLRARPKAPGRIQLVVDGKPGGDWVEFGMDSQGALELPDVSEFLEPGRHTLELRMEQGSAMPYSLAVEYHNATPASSKECRLELSASLSDREVEEGAVSEANVVIENLSDETLPMPVAIIGIPGGLEPRHDHLKEMVKAKTIASYEVIGRDVVLYWRRMRPREKKELALSLLAAVPGTYTGPASRAYLYYTDEHKCWVEGLSVAISALRQSD